MSATHAGVRPGQCHGVWMRLDPETMRRRGARRQAGGIVATAAFGFPLLAFAGFQFAPASHGGVMLPGMLPLLTALLLWLVLGERWTLSRVVSLGLVLLGVALLALETFGEHRGAWRGDLLLFCGSFSWALYTLMARIWRIPPLQATLARCSRRPSTCRSGSRSSPPGSVRPRSARCCSR